MFRTASEPSRFLIPAAACLLSLGMAFTAACGTSEREGSVAPDRAQAAAKPPSPVAMPSHPQGPVAERHEFLVGSPHGSRSDPYYWLRDDTRKSPAVLAYLEAENRYKDQIMAPAAELEAKLYDEMVGRIAQADDKPPYRRRGYLYSVRYVEGGEYPLYIRRRDVEGAQEEIMLDGNRLAEGHEFYQVRNLRVSPDQKLVAYAEDTVGRRKYALRFKNLKTGQTLSDTLPNTTASVTWAGDSQTVFYVERDPVTLLGTRVKRHRLGTPVSADVVVYEEPDHSYYMSVSRTGDDAYVLINLSSTVANEVRYLPAAKPEGAFKVFAARERDHEYDVDHIAGQWIVRSNWQARNFRILKVADGPKAGERSQWQELVPHSEAVLISDFALFDNFLVTGEREQGIAGLRIRPWQGGATRRIDGDEPVYVAGLDVNVEQNTPWLRYRYASLTTPQTIYEFNMQTGERRLLDQDEVLGGYDASKYTTARLWAKARDGRQIPISVVHRRDVKLDGTAPLYQYGYGSYGSSIDPHFKSSILSLLDRGFVYAIAHIRGGQEMGRAWYENGRQFAKMNTFTDFIDVTEHLIDAGYAHPKKVAIAGGSAGGLLVGAVVNMRPELYRVAVAHVPFVDVVTTMLDESIPLTTNEFDEWGNPKRAPDYAYMLSYSPYDNIADAAYPAMLVTTGLWDSQVQYFEPAKWVAKLRAYRTDRKYPLIMQTNMEAGHGGASGRFRRLKQKALEFAFILKEFADTDA